MNLIQIDKPYLVLYDGDCGICLEIINRFEKNDYGKLFSFTPYQKYNFSERKEITPQLASETVVLIDIRNGNYYFRGEAILLIMQLMGGIYGKISKIINYLHLNGLINLIYKFVAKNRAKISVILGFKTCNFQTQKNMND